MEVEITKVYCEDCPGAGSTKKDDILVEGEFRAIWKCRKCDKMFIVWRGIRISVNELSRATEFTVRKVDNQLVLLPKPRMKRTEWFEELDEEVK